MVAKRSGWLAALGAAVVGGILFIAHGSGLFVDDAARAVTRVGTGTAALHVLDDPAASAAVKQGISTFRDLRKGTDLEVVVANAGCAIMKQDVTGSVEQAAFEQQIRAQLPVEATQFPRTVFVDRYVSSAANAMTVASANGGAGRWYVKYCLLL